MSMLSRTAENMFWMGRYMERADATARLIEMGYRMAMLPGSNEQEEWRSVAAASGSAPDIVEDKKLDGATVVQRLLLDAGQSILDPLVPDIGARQRTGDPHGADAGHVGSAQRWLALSSARWMQIRR